MSNIDSHVGELTPQFPISAVNTTLTATTGPTTGPINKSKKLMAMEKHEPPKEQMFMEETIFEILMKFQDIINETKCSKQIEEKY